jgi:hypothetical protein
MPAGARFTQIDIPQKPEDVYRVRKKFLVVGMVIPLGAEVLPTSIATVEKC